MLMFAIRSYRSNEYWRVVHKMNAISAIDAYIFFYLKKNLSNHDGEMESKHSRKWLKASSNGDSDRKMRTK